MTGAISGATLPAIERTLAVGKAADDHETISAFAAFMFPDDEEAAGNFTNRAMQERGHKGRQTVEWFDDEEEEEDDKNKGGLFGPAKSGGGKSKDRKSGGKSYFRG